jgi:ribosome maturation factor RimP
MRNDIDDLWRLLEPPIEGAGLDLVELQWNREPEGWVLRVFIDRPEGPKVPGGDGDDPTVFEPMYVGHEDCERVSRDLSATLDVADCIHHAYRLEVSSPGIERPLRRERDFNRYAGQKVKIRTTDPVAGRRNFSGVLAGSKEGQVEVDCEGRTYQLPIKSIVRANLVPDWDAEFHRQSQEHPRPLSDENKRGSSKQNAQGPFSGEGPARKGRSHPTPRSAS